LSVDQIHAVVLPSSSKVIESYVLQFNFTGVSIKSVHRKTGVKVSLSDKTRFEGGDVVLLQGGKKELIKAEQVLIEKSYESPV